VISCKFMPGHGVVLMMAVNVPSLSALLRVMVQEIDMSIASRLMCKVFRRVPCSQPVRRCQTLSTSGAPLAPQPRTYLWTPPDLQGKD
jgi:hypothetical protein